ncbi:hypothetical protein NEMBOFW57_003876 [Staphylotrichum longicolle]|uniref:Cyanovirin-N domain-containing protein n=1 Tax=Staphylotrichum longicolle TaxID=669026 RepID=A0AAD4F640_9PEZI|nr:hypothetical protein NEMBOFW57_003876 [Staphylotrichum longicolle]
MVKFVLSLAAATIAAAAVLPNAGLNSSLATTTLPKKGDTHNVGERGELIGRLLGQCGDDTLFENLHNTWIDLNWCLGNDNGKLAWQDGGNAILTCINCSSRTFDTQWITCECEDTEKRWFISSLDLNLFFQSDEGVRYDMDRHVLACYQHFGVWSPSG